MADVAGVALRDNDPMSRADDAVIFRWLGLCALLVLGAIVLPRFLPQTEGGFAAAASAVLLFLGLLFAAWGVALGLLVVAIRRWSRLGRAAQIAGIVPAVLLAIALFGLVGWLRY